MKKKMIVASLVLALALFAFSMAGCSGSEDNHEGHGQDMHSDAGKAQTTCPVMGNKIKKSVYADHDGERVYFCCPMCIKKFKADPEKLIKKLENSGVVLEKTQ